MGPRGCRSSPHRLHGMERFSVQMISPMKKFLPQSVAPCPSDPTDVDHLGPDLLGPGLLKDRTAPCYMALLASSKTHATGRKSAIELSRRMVGVTAHHGIS